MGEAVSFLGWQVGRFNPLGHQRTQVVGIEFDGDGAEDRAQSSIIFKEVEKIEQMLDALDDEEAVELLLSAPDALPGEVIPFPCPRPDSGPPPPEAA